MRDHPRDDPNPPASDVGAVAVSPTPLPANVRVLGFTSLLNDIASEAIFPLLPQVLLGMVGGNRFYLGVIEGLAETVASLLKLFSGAWSDRLRQRKWLVVAGYGLAALARPATALVVVPWQLLVTRVADRVGKGIRTAPRDALLADSTPLAQHGRAFGFHRAMDHLGAALGPLAASAFLWIWPESLSTLFLLTIVPGLAVVAMLVWGLREPTDEPATIAPPDAPTDKPIRSASESLRWSGESFGGDFRRLLIAIGVFTLGNSSDAFLLVRAGELGVPTMLLPALWSAFHVVKSVGNARAGRAVDRWGPRPLLLAGWALYAVLYLAFALATSAVWMCVVFLTYGLVYALVEPSEKTLVTRLVGPARKGLAFGWMHCVTGIAALPSSVAFGWLYEHHGPLAAFGSGAALALCAALILATIRK